MFSLKQNKTKKNQPLLPPNWIGLVVHTCNPSIRKPSQKDLCEFETRQEYMGDPASKTKNKLTMGWRGGSVQSTGCSCWSWVQISAPKWQLITIHIIPGRSGRPFLASVGTSMYTYINKKSTIKIRHRKVHTAMTLSHKNKKETDFWTLILTIRVDNYCESK